jgi:hypothetical protein
MAMGTAEATEMADVGGYGNGDGHSDSNGMVALAMAIIMTFTM